MPNGYYDETGHWKRTKYCFRSCGDRCTCMPPGMQFYSEAHDVKKKQMNCEHAWGPKLDGSRCCVKCTIPMPAKLECEMFCAWKGGGPCHDCPRRTNESLKGISMENVRR